MDLDDIPQAFDDVDEDDDVWSLSGHESGEESDGDEDPAFVPKKKPIFVSSSAVNTPLSKSYQIIREGTMNAAQFRAWIKAPDFDEVDSASFTFVMEVPGDNSRRVPVVHCAAPEGNRIIIHNSADVGKQIVRAILGREHAPPTGKGVSSNANAKGSLNADEQELASIIGGKVTPYPEAYRKLLKAEMKTKAEAASNAGKSPIASAPKEEPPKLKPKAKTKPKAAAKSKDKPPSTKGSAAVGKDEKEKTKIEPVKLFAKAAAKAASQVLTPVKKQPREAYGSKSPKPSRLTPSGSALKRKRPSSNEDESVPKILKSTGTSPLEGFKLKEGGEDVAVQRQKIRKCVSAASKIIKSAAEDLATITEATSSLVDLLTSIVP